MNDLISRQGVIEVLSQYPFEKVVNCISIIEAFPSAQPEIVRCKDCKFVGTDATCCLVCNREGMGLRPFHVYHDDFCSYAERRKG